MTPGADSDMPGVRDRLVELQQITAALSAAATLEQVGHVITDRARSALGADTSSLWASRGPELVIVASFGRHALHGDSCSLLSLDTGFPDPEIVRSRQARWVESEPHSVSTSLRPAESGQTVGGPRGYAALPLVVEDRVVGIAAFGYNREHPFSEGEKAFAQTIASHCAQALERARLLDVAREASATFGAVFQSSHAAIMLLDADGTVQLWNPAAERMFGWSADEAVGRFFPGAGEKYRFEYLRNLSKVVVDGMPLEGVEAVRIRKGGGAFHAAIWSALVLRADGARQCLSVVVDVTARKQAEAERSALLERERAARAEAERANRVKDEFLATLSHELRTPLNAITGWVHMLLSDKLPPDRRAHALEVILRNARAQEKLVADLLDMSRVVSGRLRLNIGAIDPIGIVAIAVEAVRPMAATKAVRIETSLDESAGEIVADADRMQQIVWNLLTNAVKFTPEGGRVRVALTRVEASVVLRVADSGQGIHKDFLPYIFEPFRQADSSFGRKSGGLGLGLAIAHTLVEMHGGTIEAHSAGEGLGAEFVVRLPLAATEGDSRPSPMALRAAPRVPAAGKYALAGARVLVVEDELDSRELLVSLLEQYGAHVTAAGSAAEALAKFAQSPPVLLVSDIGLPGEDGLALVRRVRALPQGAHIAAIALTAFAREEDRERALQAGFDVHLPKPVDPNTLVLAMHGLLESGGSTRVSRDRPNAEEK